jgi:hypothetical protein
MKHIVIQIIIQLAKPAVWAYYTARNLFYYRKERPINLDMQFELMHELIVAGRQSDEEGVQHALTSIYLARVGLCVAARTKQSIPKYVLLSAVQREWAKKVFSYGYQVGLL